MNLSRRILIHAGLVVALFVLLQVVLWAMGAIPGSQVNVWWWMALSTLADRNGFFNVWTPYPPVFTIFHYVGTKLFAGDTEVLARYFFEGDRSVDVVAAYDHSFVVMKRVWVVFNAVFIAAQAWLVYRLHCAIWNQGSGIRDRESGIRDQGSGEKRDSEIGNRNTGAAVAATSAPRIPDSGFQIPAPLLAAGAFVLFNLTWRSQIVIGLGCDQFDYFPSFFYLLGLWLLVEDKPRGAAVITAVGALIKIYPGLLVPLAWAKEGQPKRAAIYTAIVVVLCLATAAPFLFVNADIFMTTYQWSGTRPGWESVWIYPKEPKEAFPPMPVPGTMVGLFDTRMPEVLVTTKDGHKLSARILNKDGKGLQLKFVNGAQAILRHTEEHGPVIIMDNDRVFFVADVINIRHVDAKYRILMLVTLAVLLGLTWYFRRALQTKEGLIRGALLYVLVLIFFSKGISSYFILWFFPFFFILYRPLVACLMFSAFLLVGNAEFMGGEDLPLFWLSIFVRQAMILGVMVEQGWRMKGVIRNEVMSNE
jgi:hypothetical protein